MKNWWSRFCRSRLFVPVFLAFLVTAFFVLLQFLHPFYFLNDDNLDLIFPYYAYAYRSLFQHQQLAVYDFHTFMGEPSLAMGETGVFNPLVYISCWLSEVILGHLLGAMDVMAYIHLLVGSLGAYFLVKSFGCSRFCAFLAGFTYACNPFTVYMGSNWMIITSTTAFFPWILYSSSRWWRQKTLANYWWAVFARIALVLTGHAQFYLYAFIFDAIVMVTLILMTTKWQWSSWRNFIFGWTRIYLSVLILTAPIIVPMFIVMQNYSLRQEKLPFAEYISMRITPGAYLAGNLNPWSFFNFSFLLGIGWALFFGVWHGAVLLERKYHFHPHTCARSQRLEWLARLVPAIFIAYSWSAMWPVAELIYFIPLLNRFRWVMKLGLFTNLLLIVFGALGLSLFIDVYCHQKKKRIIAYFLCMVMQLLFFALTYVHTPHYTYGVYHHYLSLKHGVSYPQLFQGRFVLAGFDYDGKLSNNAGDYYGYNTAAFFGLNNYYGYRVMISEKLYDPAFNAWTASIHLPMIEDRLWLFRKRGVSWYLVPIAKRKEAATIFTKYGIKEVFNNDTYIVYQDELAKPLVYTPNPKAPNAAQAITYQQQVNSIQATTDDDFPGGNVVFNYLYHPYFRFWLDGKPAAILPSGDGTSMLVKVPPGAHRLKLVYFDPALSVSVLVAGVFAWAAAGYSHYHQHHASTR